MPTAQEIKQAFPGYAGWNDENAIVADFNATGGAGKKGNGGGSSSGETGTKLPGFSFDWDVANAQAMAELAPYYKKLIDMYKGDIALAKQHMDQDYERGLRVQSEKTTTGLGDIETTRAERKRKFDLALKDLDQTMNARGLTTSGIKTGEQNKMTADEAYQQKQLDNQARDLTTGLQYYKEDIGATRDKQLEQWGMKPVTTATPTGEFAPSNEGLNMTGYDVSKFTPDPVQKQAGLEKQQALDAASKSENAFNRAYTLWQAQIQQLNS